VLCGMGVELESRQTQRCVSQGKRHRAGLAVRNWGIVLPIAPGPSPDAKVEKTPPSGSALQNPLPPSSYKSTPGNGVAKVPILVFHSGVSAAREQVRGIIARFQEASVVSTNARRAGLSSHRRP